MSDKTKELIREAIQEYQSEDGASRLGSYRDVVTDLLHLAHGSEILRAEQNNPPGRTWLTELHFLVQSAYDSFMEERSLAETEEVNQIPQKDLPLYIEHDWEFYTSTLRVEERLKENS